jgi:hypothetical protein
MATGSFARSSQPLTQSNLPSIESSKASTPTRPYHRVRKRGVIPDGSEVDSEGLSKRLKSENIENEALELFITTMKIVGQEHLQRPLNTFELAITLLEDEYGTCLSESHYLQAANILESESKASIFIAINARIRDQWLCKNAGVELLDKTNWNIDF